MQCELDIRGVRFRALFSSPIDLSIPIQDRGQHPNAFYAPYVDFSPYTSGDFVGSTLAGSPVNFKNVRINPHGNGTHTECVGHITTTGETINNTLKEFHFSAELISIYPTKQANGDLIIDKTHFEALQLEGGAQAIIIRTLPNSSDKLTREYSGQNPPYLTEQATEYLVSLGFEHLLIDTPSVDKEEDEGKLLSHKAWWGIGDERIYRPNATITEFIFVPDEIKDGLFLLNLQIASFELDASPSKPVIYPIEEYNYSL